jgi:ABC-type sugar transport system ATPase subunit
VSSLELRGVTIRRAGVAVLDGVDLRVADAELVALVGASGAGKSTLLRAIAGVERLDGGQIVIDGVDVTAEGPAGRGVSMVFQQPVLMPRRSVRRNVSFPLEVRHVPAEEIRTRVDAESRALHIEDLLGREPGELSAGEAQLVQIARAMVRVPGLLLLDEPLAHLDPAVRTRLRRELRTLQQGYGVTTLLATNEPVEAMTMPDRLVVLADGRVRQEGLPVDVYADPVDLSAAAFTGDVSTIEVRVERDAVGFWFVHPAMRTRAWAPALAGAVGRRVLLGLRPDSVALDAAGDVVATVAQVEAGGAGARVRCAVGDDRVDVRAGGRPPAVGDRVRLRFDRPLVFDPVTGSRLALDVGG